MPCKKKKKTPRAPVQRAVCGEEYQTLPSPSLEGSPVGPNVISRFKDTRRGKAERSRPAREGRREAAAFTVSRESLQPTVLDLCHARSLLLSFFPSPLGLSVGARSSPLRRPGQPACSLWLLLRYTGNTVGLVSNATRRVGGR